MKTEHQRRTTENVIENSKNLMNYNVYKLSAGERIGFSLVGFAIGAIVSYIFYGGIGKNEYGDATPVTLICNTIIMCTAGLVTAKVFCSLMTKVLLDNRRKNLHRQFIDLLDSLSASLSTGQNVPSAFLRAEEDLRVQYPDDSFIVLEVRNINDGFRNNIEIEKMLVDFGRRSGIKDIANFGKVFETAYRKGGNIRDIVRNTHEILSTKTQIELEIETKVSATKNEQNIMLVMPVLIVGMIKMMGGDFADKFTTPNGLLYTTAGIGAFVIAFFIGRSILDIEV